MDVVAAAEAAMEALAPPPAAPVTVFPEVEVSQTPDSESRYNCC